MNLWFLCETTKIVRNYHGAKMNWAKQPAFENTNGHKFHNYEGW